MPVDVAAHFRAVDEVTGYFLLPSRNWWRPEVLVLPPPLAGTQRQGAAPERQHCLLMMLVMKENPPKNISL